MRHYLLLICLLANFSFADYSSHPEAKELIDSLVQDHNFEQSYVVSVLQAAKKQTRILDSMSSPAEFTWTWDRYKKLFLEEKRIENGKLFLSKHNDLFNRVENESVSYTHLTLPTICSV